MGMRGKNRDSHAGFPYMGKVKRAIVRFRWWPLLVMKWTGRMIFHTCTV